MIAVFTLWGASYKNAENLEKVRLGVDRIILFAQEEFSCTSNNTFFRELAEQSNSQNVPFEIVIGSSSQFLLNFDITHYKNITIHSWGTYWMLRIVSLLPHDEAPSYAPGLTYPFICLNNRSHLHRCMMIDQLEKYDLIKDAAVSWRDELQSGHGPSIKLDDPLLSHLHDDSFLFKYWKPKRIFLTEPGDRLESLQLGGTPQEYRCSFAHLVTESSADIIIFSEKTCIPILQGKPFITLAAPGYHAELIKLGFVLYDEMFDYSFDRKTDLSVRCEAIALNMKKISKMSVHERKAMYYGKLLPKIKHNHQRYMEILSDTSLVPDIIKDAVKYPAAYYTAGYAGMQNLTAMFYYINKSILT